MLSEVILSELSYSALPLAGQPIHQRFVHSGPLVLGVNLLKNQRLQQIGDQPVSRFLGRHLIKCLGFSHITVWNGLELYPNTKCFRVVDVQSLRALTAF